MTKEVQGWTYWKLFLCPKPKHSFSKTGTNTSNLYVSKCLFQRVAALTDLRSECVQCNLCGRAQAYPGSLWRQIVLIKNQH